MLLPVDEPWPTFDAVVAHKWSVDLKYHDRSTDELPFDVICDGSRPSAILAIGNVERPENVEDIWFTAKSGSSVEMILADLLGRRQSNE